MFMRTHCPANLQYQAVIRRQRDPGKLFHTINVTRIILVLQPEEYKFALPEIEICRKIPFILHVVVW